MRDRCLQLGRGGFPQSDGGRMRPGATRRCRLDGEDEVGGSSRGSLCVASLQLPAHERWKSRVGGGSSSRSACLDERSLRELDIDGLRHPSMPHRVSEFEVRELGLSRRTYQIFVFVHPSIVLS